MNGKQQRMLYCLDKWMRLREQGITITEYCKERNAKLIGIYGYGRLGKHLVWELENQNLCIPWIMDRRYDDIHIDNKGCSLLSPDDRVHIQNVDMIIVTAIEDYYDIEARLSRFTNVEVMSLEQLINLY